jgi:hypothetical protein
MSLGFVPGFSVESFVSNIALAMPHFAFIHRAPLGAMQPFRGRLIVRPAVNLPTTCHNLGAQKLEELR